MADKIDKQLLKRDIKPTAMRTLVFKVMIEQNKALSLTDLEDLFDRADKATLYRTLKTFEEKKLIHKINDGTGAVKYAVCSSQCECDPDELHVHFHCTTCNNTICLDQVSVPFVNLPIGFSLSSVNMVVYGECISCSK